MCLGVEKSRLEETVLSEPVLDAEVVGPYPFLVKVWIAPYLVDRAVACLIKLPEGGYVLRIARLGLDEGLLCKGVARPPVMPGLKLKSSV